MVRSRNYDGLEELVAYFLPYVPSIYVYIDGTTRGDIHRVGRTALPIVDVKIELKQPLPPGQYIQISQITHLRKTPYLLKKSFNKKFGYRGGYTYI